MLLNGIIQFDYYPVHKLVYFDNDHGLRRIGRCIRIEVWKRLFKKRYTSGILPNQFPH